MAIQNPILNPIRFYDPTQLPNYADRWPNMDNIDFYVEYQKGIYASQFYQDFRLNEEMTIQFRYDSSVTNTEIYVYKMNLEDGTFSIVATLTPVSVSPSGWTLTPVYNYYWTPSESGVYYFDFDDADYRSGRFIVHSDEKFLKRLVEVKYWHYENKYGMVYYTDDLQTFTGVSYFQGRLAAGEPTNEISEYTDDPGEVQLLSATPQRSTVLELFQLHYTYIDNINLIFSGSEIFINGIQYQNIEAPTIERIPNSDLVNVIVNLFQKNNDYFTK